MAGLRFVEASVPFQETFLVPNTNSWDLYRDLNTLPTDPEFQAKLRALAGLPMPVDPSLARPEEAVKGLRGVWTSPQAPAQRMLELENKVGKQLESDKIYAFGEENYTPQVWAHEYRHRAGVYKEGLNRIYDAAMAGSAKKWDFAIKGYWEWLKDKGMLSEEAKREDVINILKDQIPIVFGEKAKSLPYNVFLGKETPAMLSSLYSQQPEYPKPIKKVKRSK